MIKIEIDLSREPECLKALRSVPTNTYDDLKDDCLTLVRNELNLAQNGFCAYCQQKFKSIARIEHYFAQSTNPNLVLQFGNYLGVCSGNYRYDQKTRKPIEHCDKSRKQLPLSVDPRILDHIETIYFNADNEIHSTNADFEADLSLVLNLNFFDLLYERQTAFDRIYNSFIESGIKLGYSKLEIFIKACDEIKKNNLEFSGFLLFRFKTLLDFELSKTKA